MTLTPVETLGIILAVAAGLFLAGTVAFGILYFRKRA